MSLTIQQRCEMLNIENNVMRYGEGMGSCIDIYIDIPDLQYQYEKQLLIQSVLLPSIKDTLEDTYPHLTLEYQYTDDMIQVGFYPTPRCEEIFIDIIEYIISIIETINEDNEDQEDIIIINYDRARTILRIL